MSVGLLVCSYNDRDLSEEMYPSLLASIQPESPPFGWGIVCVDAGSTDGSVDFWEGNCPVIHKDNMQLLGPGMLNMDGEDLKHLSKALNAGFKLMMLGDAEGKHKYDYICHIHPDMKFPQANWLETLTKYMDDNPDVAKLAADYASLPESARTERPGNQCPWIMRVTAAQELIDDDGFIFDPGYIGIGGLEDWDINARLINLGYKVWITPTVVVEHEGMGTRKRHDTNADATANRKYYHEKWGAFSPPV